MLLANRLDTLHEYMLTSTEHHYAHYDNNGSGGAIAEAERAI